MVVVCPFCLSESLGPDVVALHQLRCYRCGCVVVPPGTPVGDFRTCARLSCRWRGQCPASCQRWKARKREGGARDADLFSDDLAPLSQTA